MLEENLRPGDSQIRRDLQRVAAAGGSEEVLAGIGGLDAGIAHVAAEFYLDLAESTKGLGEIPLERQQRLLEEHHIQSMFGLDEEL